LDTVLKFKDEIENLKISTEPINHSPAAGQIWDCKSIGYYYLIQKKLGREIYFFLQE